MAGNPPNPFQIAVPGAVTPAVPNGATTLSSHQLAGIQGAYIPTHDIPNKQAPYSTALANAYGNIQRDTIQPHAQEYSVVRLLRDQNGGGIGRASKDVNADIAGYAVSDWSLKNMDKMLLSEHRKIQMIEDPISGRKKRFAEFYGVRNKYILEMEKVKRTLKTELLLQDDEAYTMAWNYLRPQFDLDMKLIRQKYPEVEGYTEKVVGKNPEPVFAGGATPPTP